MVRYKDQNQHVTLKLIRSKTIINCKHNLLIHITFCIREVSWTPVLELHSLNTGVQSRTLWATILERTRSATEDYILIMSPSANLSINIVR